MLQFLRGHASSWVIKILLGLIVASFAIWGVGGLFMGRGNQALVAKVGKVEITKQAFLHEVQRRLQAANRELKGAHLSLEQAVKMGLHAKILDDLVQRALLEQELEDLNLAASPALLSALTREDPSFKNEQGRFDGAQFKRFLKSHGLTESQYLAHRAHGLIEAQFLSGITAASRPAGSLSLWMFRDLFQERTVTLYTVDEGTLAKNSPDLKKINAAELKSFYEKHSDLYKTQEKRSFEVLVLDPKQLEKQYTPSQKEIEAAYDQQADNYVLPEKRDLQVCTDHDWKKVKIISKLMEDGSALPPHTTTTFYRIDQGELSDVLGQKAFELKAGEVSEVFKGDNGEFQVVKVLKIIPPTSQPLHKVQAQVVADLKRQKAMDTMAALVQTVEDAISGGASLEEVAKTHHLDLIRTSELTILAKGNEAAKGLKETMIKTAFEQQVGEAGPVVEMEDGTAYVVSVTKLVPQHVRSLEEVKGIVQEAIFKERLHQAVEKKIKDILSQEKLRHALLSDGTVHSMKLPTMSFMGLKDRPDITQEMRNAFWSLKKDQGVRVVYKDRPAVAVLDSTKKAVAEQHLGDYANLKNEIMELLNRDLLSQYFSALKERHGVTIYEDVLSNLTETA